MAADAVVASSATDATVARIVLFTIGLPITLASFVITTKLMFALLGIGLMLAFVGYIVLLPATTAATLLGREDDPKFVFGAAAVVVALIFAGLTWFSLDQRAKSEVLRQQRIADVRAGEKILCDHPDASLSSPLTCPASWLHETVQVNGWTCWAGGDTVYHPRGEQAFLKHFEFPYE